MTFILLTFLVGLMVIQSGLIGVRLWLIGKGAQTLANFTQNGWETRRCCLDAKYGYRVNKLIGEPHYVCEVALECLY
jgi:hypothetical protein